MFTFLNPQSPEWGAELRWIGQQFTGLDRSALFPYHFLHSTLPRIGGQVGYLVHANERIAAAAFFPRQRSFGQERTYTLRYHHLPGRPRLDADTVNSLAAAHLEHGSFYFYDPTAPQLFSPTHQFFGVVDIGRPSAHEAHIIRELHRQIWGADESDLYPTDIHSIDFALGTSLVARVEGRVVGFLIGFYKFGGPTLPANWAAEWGGDYRLESQILGVLPDYRGLRIASLLKKVQAEQAWREGVGVVNWTADSLQYANAALNFGLLRAIAFHFYPDFYPFRNDLNRVSASRFALTWLVGSRRVQEKLTLDAGADVLDLRWHPDVYRVNENWRRLEMEANAPMIAIEIPANWTQLQREDAEEAQRWRNASDLLFGRYLGMEPGQYVLTGVAVERERRFLLGEQVSDQLWARLAN